MSREELNSNPKTNPLLPIITSSAQVADECSNKERAAVIRELTASIVQTAAQFETVRCGPDQEALANTLRRDMATLEQHVRSAAAGNMTQAAMSSHHVQVRRGRDRVGFGHSGI